jgi:uncharacterized protein (DUF2252 family)
VEERISAGKALRDATPLDSHAGWKPHKRRLDPIKILEAQNKTRIPSLIPIRFGRMLQCPFSFLRGAAAIMAADLADTPTSGIRVQACGDCHLVNFGVFGTPERGLIFDINDFDETLPAPWEWDVKRLATSFVMAGRNNGLREKDNREAAREMVRTYRTQMAEFARMHVLDVWYAKLELETLLANTNDPKWVKKMRTKVKKARKSESDIFPTMTTLRNGRVTIKEEQPLIFHLGDPTERKAERIILRMLDRYRETLGEHHRTLFDRFRFIDIANKVVGIGSVGTSCYVVLFMATAEDPLFLQLKEANASVLEPYTDASLYKHEGQRVVMGQRLMQSASDIFLGWTTGRNRSRHFYVRQLRDWKVKPVVESFNASRLFRYAQATGWTLARAHARSEKAPEIKGYLGKKDIFDDAIVEFATDYADQTERDHGALVKEVRSGRIEATMQD